MPYARSVVLSDLDLHLFGEGTHRRLWQLLGAQALPEGGAYVLKADPMARQSECPPSNASVVAGADDYVWHDGEWMDGRSHEPGAPLRIYEAHIGSWRSGVDSYVEFGRQLADHVVALGFTHVELLPVAEHPFGGSWGYQVSGYYAPTARYGSPDELRAMVDILHSRGIGVIIDWVPAHFPKDEWSLARFDGTGKRLWGTYHGGENEEVHVGVAADKSVASMLYLDYSRPAGGWVPNRNGGRENLDAIAFLRELNTVVAEEAPTAMVIAEESTAWPKVTHPISHGGLGFTHKWNMGWMNDTLGYLEHDSVHRRYHHRELSFGLLYAFAERFVLPLSHDEVVHGKGSLLSKMPGDDWQRFANLRALYAWMWAQPGAPLLFMGAEIAPFTEWNESTGLPWHLLDHAPHRGIRDLLAELNRVVASWPALFERDHEPTGFQWLDADDAAHSVYAFLRWGFAGGRAVAAVANFTPVPHSGYRIGLPWAGEWQVLLDTDSPNYGGSGFAGYDLDGLRTGTAVVTATTEVSWQGQPASAVIDLSPLAVLWLGAARP